MGNRKKPSASAAQAAADLYAKTGATSIPAGNFTFGARFIDQVSSGVEDDGSSSTSTTSMAGQDASVGTTSLRVQKCIQHLSKNDARTRQRALSSLKEYLEEDVSEALGLLGYWSKQFPKLMKDPSKHVRIASCELTLVLSTCVGRNMGKIIKDVFPPLFFAQYDENDVAQVASSVLHAMLPGNKTDKAVDMCLEEIVSAMKQGMLAPGNGSKYDDQAYTLMMQYTEGAKAMFRMKKPEISAIVYNIIRDEDFSLLCLHGRHQGVRRQAYSLIAEMSMNWNNEPITDVQFIVSVFKSLQDQDSRNYLDVLTMIIAFGRAFVNVWEFIDAEEDFFRPLRRIATEINQNNSLNDVNKIILPLIALPPSGCCGVVHVSGVLEAVWKAHDESSHHAKSCMTVASTIKECVEYCTTSIKMNTGTGEFFSMILGALDRSTISSCSQVIASLCIRDIAWSEEDLECLLEELRNRRDSMVNEHILAKLGPLLSSLPAKYKFIDWELGLLSKAVTLADSYWLRGNIDFSLSILQSVWSLFTEKGGFEKGKEHLDKSITLLQATISCPQLMPVLQNKLLERSAVATDDVLYEILARTVFLVEDPSSVFYQILSSLKPTSASGLVMLMGRMHDVSDIMMCSLRSNDVDQMFLMESHRAIISEDIQRLHFCTVLLKGKCPRGLVSIECIEKAIGELLDLTSHQESIDSKSILLQLLNSMIAYDDTILHSFGGSKKILTFTLQTSWEEFLLDLCGDHSVTFDVGWREIVESNDTLQACHVILMIGSARFFSDRPLLEEWIENTLMPEIDSNSGFIPDYSLPMYCLIHFIVSLVPDTQKARVFIAFKSILGQMPATALEIFGQSEQDTIVDLTRDSNGLDLLNHILTACVEEAIPIGSLVHVIMEGHQSYESMLQYLANVQDDSINVLVLLLSAGLESSDSSIQDLTFNFCDATLFNTSQNDWQNKVLTEVANSIRKNDHLLYQSGLVSFTCSLLDMDLDDVLTTYNDTLNACLGHYTVAETYGWHLLHPNSPTWYRDSKYNNEWKKSKILSRDDSIQPPSFVVEVGGSVRETEPSRLRIAQFGIFSLPCPEEKIEHTQILLYDDEEIKKIIRLVKYLNERDDILLPDPSGLNSIACFSVVPSVWDKLSSEERGNSIKRISNSLKRSYYDMDALVEDFSKSLVDTVNQVIGPRFGNLTETLRFMMGLRTNSKLQRVPKIQELYITLQESMYTGLVAYQSVHGEAIYAAVHAFIALLNQEHGILHKKEFQSEFSKISLDIASIFFAMGYFMGLSQSIFGIKDQSKSYIPWLQFSSLLECLSSAIQAIDVHNPNLVELMSKAGSRNTQFDCVPSMISLCLNNGISGKAARAAFIIGIKSTDVMNSIWFNDPESFYQKMEEIISHPERHVTEAMPDLLDQCGLNEHVARGIADPSCVDFVPSWCLLLSFLTNPHIDSSQKELLVALLKEFSLLTAALLDYIVNSLQISPKSLDDLDNSLHGGSKKLQENFSHYLQYLNNDMNSFILGNADVVVPIGVLLVGLLTSLPVACRTWFIGLKDRKSKMFIEELVRSKISPFLIKEEFEIIDMDDSDGQESNFHIKSVKIKNQILASMEVEDGHSIDLRVSFPKEYPLKAPHAKLEKYIGISEAKARKWNLSIAAFLMNRNGTVSEVIQTWKKNVSQEFEGHEDCLICYSIIQPSTGQLPRLTCKTCHQKYHGTCLYKWFKTSGKSNCVHCQSPW